MEDSELLGIQVFQHLNCAAGEKSAVSVFTRTVSAYLESASPLCCSKARGCFGTQVDDVIEAGSVIVPLAHAEIGSYVESFEIDVAV